MDALVYEDTPLADYFEGEATPDNFSREQTPPPAPFAPRGLPNFTRRLRKIRRSATSIAPGSAYTEELLERFRYIIVASQLLSDETGPRHTFAEHDNSASDLATLRGAVTTAAASFLAAWVVHWLRTRKQGIRPQTWTWIELASYGVGIVLVGIVIALFGRRQYTNYLQRASVRTLSKYVDDSHSLDTAAGNIIRFVQEVEVVSRGYELGSPFPPISRLEDRNAVRRCQTLRRELAAALKLLTIVMVESHDVLQPCINRLDVQRYHDIYEVSLVEYSQAIDLLNRNEQEEVQVSLKDLRFSVRLHALARKVLLCDLMALQQSTGWSRVRQWSGTLSVLREIEAVTASNQVTLVSTLAAEEWGGGKTGRRSVSTSSQSDIENNQPGSTVRMQLRRFDDIRLSVRALNAKMHLFHEEINGMSSTDSDDATTASLISKHYDLIGSELRSIMFEWDQGKSSMLASTEADHERGSCSSGSVRTPVSPAPSHGSLQIVDGGPADALRLLTGESPSFNHTKGIFEEEVYEAVASRVPRKRMSIGGMTREEKMAKLAEDRRKRATMQEQSENTTNMLRELQMVIKHRPKGSLPSNNINNTGSQRIATL